MKRQKIITPNIINGGIAIPLGNNYYYMKGRKHKDGGIDIGPNNKNGLEVEDGEIMKTSPKEVKVYSSVPFLNGRSPVEKLLGGENPTTVFRQQEEYKNRNGINDDGTRKGNTKKAKMGTEDTENPIIKGLGYKPMQFYDKNVDVSSTFYNPIDDTYGTINLPEVSVIPKYKTNEQHQKTLNAAEGRRGAKYVRDAIHNYAFPIAAPIVTGAALPAISSTVGLGIINNTLDAVNLITNPLDPTNYIPIANNVKKVKINRVRDKIARNVGNKGKKWLYDYYGSNRYKDKQHLGKILTSNKELENTGDIYRSVLEKPIKIHSIDDILYDGLTRYDKKTKLPVIEINTNNTTSNMLSTAVHEFGHASYKHDNSFRHYVDNVKPYNESLINLRDKNKIKDDLYGKYIPYDATEEEVQKSFKYLVNSNEIRSRALELEKAAKDAGVSVDDIIDRYTFKVQDYMGTKPGTPYYLRQLINVMKPNDLKTYMKYFLGVPAITIFNKENNKKAMGGLSRYKDYGSKSKPYPKVDKKDFAGGHRSYPIPTKADAVDALRLAGLHGRGDVRSKVYNKYPDLRKKSKIGTKSNNNTSLVEPKKPDIIDKFNPTSPNFGLPTNAQPILNKETIGVMTTNKYLNAISPKGVNRFNADMEYRYAKQHPEYNKGDITKISNNTKPEKLYMFSKDSYGGGYNPNTNEITINQAGDHQANTYIHELRHLLDHNLNQKDNVRKPRSLNKNEEFMLRNAYRFNEDVGTFKHYPNAFRLEAPAINTQLRHNISLDNGYVTGEKLDNIIDNMNDETLQEYYENVNGYTQGKRPKDYNALKRALKNVAQNNNTPDLNKFIAKYGINMKRKFKTGGVVRLKYNNKDTLLHVSNIDNSLLKNSRRKAKAGFKGLTKENNIGLNRVSYSLGDIDNIDFPENFNAYGKTSSPSKKTKFINTLRNIGTNIGQFSLNNADTLTSLSSNIISNIIGNKINKNALDKMKYDIPEWKTSEYNVKPIITNPTSLKTRFNVNAQIRALDESQRQFEKDVDAATSSSQVAIARKQANRMNNVLTKNRIYEDKENKETSLINQDKLNKQQVELQNANILNTHYINKAKFDADQLEKQQNYYNQQILNKQAFENNIIDKKAENKINTIQNINAGIQNIISNLQQRRKDNQTIAAMSIANPNLPIEVLYEQGLVNKRVYNAYKKAYKNKKYNS